MNRIHVDAPIELPQLEGQPVDIPHIENEVNPNFFNEMEPPGHWALVPYVAPKPIRVWPNLHSLFTLATLAANVACLAFSSPLLIGANLTLRCVSIALSLHGTNKVKMSSEIISILAILIIKNGSLVATASDLVFEGINFFRCEVSREQLKSRCTAFFHKKEKPLLDLTPFFRFKDPTIPESACAILGIPLEQINNQEFIDRVYNSGVMELHLRRLRRLTEMRSPFALQTQRLINNREAAYQTLKKRNEANASFPQPLNQAILEVPILNTPQGIYETVITHLPSARVIACVQRTGGIAINIIVDSNLHEIHLNSAVDKEIFETRLRRIKLMQIVNAPLDPLVLDCSAFSFTLPIMEWQQFNRSAFENEGGCYVTLITAYLNNPSQENEQTMLNLGLAPNQVCQDGYRLANSELAYFRSVLNKEPELSSKMQINYPGILEQI